MGIIDVCNSFGLDSTSTETELPFEEFPPMSIVLIKGVVFSVNEDEFLVALKRLGGKFVAITSVSRGEFVIQINSMPLIGDLVVITSPGFERGLVVVTNSVAFDGELVVIYIVVVISGTFEGFVVPLTPVTFSVTSKT